jgi:ABC-type methionine transport system ATPase subunit
MTTKKKDADIAKFEMNFPSKMIEEPIMHKLSTDHRVIPNILRGRITAHSAKLEVELSGKPKDIEQAIEYLKSKGVSMRKLKD